jgi:predicted transcriptional regulator
MVQEERLLVNPTRRNLYHHILAYPGVSLPVLKRVFGIPEGTLRYHLRHLEKGDRIRSQLRKGKRCFYPSGGSELEISLGERVPGLSLSRSQERILFAINRKPGIGQKDLSRAIDMNRFTLAYNIKHLMEAGLIMRWRDGKETRYRYLTKEELDLEIIRRASIDLLRGRISESTFRSLRRKIETGG